MNEKDPELEAWCDELEVAMGGREASRKLAWACGVVAGNTKVVSPKSSPRIGMYGKFPSERTQWFGLARQF